MQPDKRVWEVWVQGRTSSWWHAAYRWRWCAQIAAVVVGRGGHVRKRL